jgi:hypothetical protein
MATQKWKRKKYQEPAGAHGEEEEFSPLGLSLLEQFASGMSAPWQHLTCAGCLQVILV